MKSIPLNVQFKSECLRRYLVKNPDDAQSQAITYFEQLSTLANRYQKLKDQNRMLKSVLLKVYRDNTNTLPDFIERILNEPEDNTSINNFSNN